MNGIMKQTVVLVLLSSLNWILGDDVNDRRQSFGSDKWPLPPERLLRWSDDTRQQMMRGPGTSFIPSRTLFQFLFGTHQGLSSFPFPSEKFPFSHTTGRASKHSEEETKLKEGNFDPSVVVVDTARNQQKTSPARNLQNSLFHNEFLFLHPWWTGPNVCVDRKEIEDYEQKESDPKTVLINMNITKCQQTEKSYTCIRSMRNNNIVKSYSVRYHCCQGFIRRTDGRTGCSKVHVRNQTDLMKKQDGSTSVEMKEWNDRAEKHHAENFSVFCPAKRDQHHQTDETKKVSIPKKDVVDILQRMDGHKIFRWLLQISGFEAHLKTSGPFTIIAPVDEAFNDIKGKDFVERMLNNKKRAEHIIKMHVIPEIICCSKENRPFFYPQEYVRSLQGNIIAVRRSIHGKIQFGVAETIECDRNAKNGVIHSINKVLPSRIW